MDHKTSREIPATRPCNYTCNSTIDFVMVIMMAIKWAVVVIVCLLSGAAPQQLPPFKIGMVRDMQLRYAPPDNDIYLGVDWFARWASQNGGLKYVQCTNKYAQIYLLLLKIWKYFTPSSGSNNRHQYTEYKRHSCPGR